MDNRITRAWDAFHEGWKSVTTTLQLELRDHSFDRYSAVMSLDGEVIERATISVVHLEGPGQVDTVIVRYESGVPRLDPEYRSSAGQPGFGPHLAHQYEQGRSALLKSALAAEGIVFNHMAIHYGPKK